jgi:hypothetical protein
MKRDAARAIILSEWSALPEAERSTQHQAAVFAMKAMPRYPFRCAGDPYQRIKGWLLQRRPVSTQ